MRERKIARLKGYNYFHRGIYFVTICTQGKESYFGRCFSGKMVLSEIGQVADKFWKEIPEHHPHVLLGECVLMPNHLHGIIIIKALKSNNQLFTNQKNTFGPLQKGSIPLIIGQYKAAVTRWCNKNQLSYFSWQPRYYDHIVRDKQDLLRIVNYIQANPIKWMEDKYFDK